MMTKVYKEPAFALPFAVEKRPEHIVYVEKVSQLCIAHVKRSLINSMETQSQVEILSDLEDVLLKLYNQAYSKGMSAMDKMHRDADEKIQSINY